jgi:phosphotransferase system IIB component
MKKRKTTKLTCIVTGRTLFASGDYYQKKVDKAGSEDELHRTYMCREAKQLIKKGNDIEKVREALNVDSNALCNITDSEAIEIVGGNDTKLKFRLNNSESVNTSIIKTDPDVKKFIENILKDD